MRVLLLIAALCSSGMAADITGIWTGQLTVRFGEIEDVSFRFTAKGDSFTGKLYGENESTSIGDAKIDGDQISFTITTEMNGGPRKVIYTGTVKGREMQLTRRRELQPGDPDTQNKAAPQVITLKRLL